MGRRNRRCVICTIPKTSTRHDIGSQEAMEFRGNVNVYMRIELGSGVILRAGKVSQWIGSISRLWY